jgi:uncharacterized protein
MTYRFKEITDTVKGIFENNKGSHDWDHTERVLNMAQKIAVLENADIDVVRYAAVLHDICRYEEDISKGLVHHEELGAEAAKKILKEKGIDDAVIEKVCACIRTHRFRRGNKPVSIEAKVLFDADKLDGIGAIGIGRAFVFAGENGARVHDPHVDIENTESYSKEDTAYREYLVKLSKIKDHVLTGTAKSIAAERHDFMVIFFNKLNDECEGES